MSQSPLNTTEEAPKLTRKDFASDQEVKWCPGCDDYSILANVQRFLPSLGIPREKFVFVSGIGCSSRFPYYMKTFGIHGIHGRAPSIATGIKLARPDLSVWVISGDGDGLSIGGNHVIHTLRRNVGLKILLFNNRVYGLTKGQHSPTSTFGAKTKSTPLGSIDYPMDPVSLALGAGATFVARAIASDAAQMQEVLKRAAEHNGSAFVEIYQNCPIFNDGAYELLTAAATKDANQLRLVNGKPLRFGKDLTKGIVENAAGEPEVVDVATTDEKKLIVHDESSEMLALMLSRLKQPDFPTPFGVFRAVELSSHEELVTNQLRHAQRNGRPKLQSLLDSGHSWIVTRKGVTPPGGLPDPEER